MFYETHINGNKYCVITEFFGDGFALGGRQISYNDLGTVFYEPQCSASAQAGSTSSHESNNALKNKRHTKNVRSS